MKAKLTLLIAALILSFSSCNNDEKEDSGRTLGSLHISKEKPQPGQTVDLVYAVDSTDGENEVEGYYRYFVGPASYPEDIHFSDSAGAWRANIVLPDSATAVAFNLSRNGKLDNNSKKGFFLPLYDKEGQPLPGSGASRGYFYYRYGNSYEVANDSAISIIEEDLEKNPELLEDWDAVYANMLYASDKEKGKAHIDNRITTYANNDDLSEKELTTLKNFYSILGDEEKDDSIYNVIAEKYPSSSALKQKYLEDLYAAENLEKKEQIFNEYNNRFGEDEKSPQKDYMIDLLLSEYARKGAWDKFEEYSSKMNDKGRLAGTLNNLAWSMAEKGEDLDKAEKLSAKSLQLLEENETKPEYLTPKQFENNQMYSERMYSDTYAFILFNQGKVGEAIQYQEKAVTEGKNSEYNKRYVQFLLADGEHKKALEKAAEYIKNNAATAKTKEYYKEAYLKVNGSNTGYEEQLAELEKAAKQTAIAQIKKKMLNEPAPAFDLQDLEGNSVSLASLKGKTVVLDFWATWCGPCKASFPGMQMAVDKFSDNEDVKFLFVNTMESGPNRIEDVRKFIADNEYSFHVVMDQPEQEGSRNFKTADDYSVPGIPTKAIIGPDGKLRFKKIGFGGNNEQMVQELEIMIDLLKEESTSGTQPAV